MNYTQKYLLDLTPFVLYFVKYKYDEDDNPSKRTFLGYPAPSELQQRKPYCLVFINSRNEKIFIHVYNDFYQILIDGESGDILYLDSISDFNFSSAVAFDHNNDGKDEIIVAGSPFVLEL